MPTENCWYRVAIWPKVAGCSLKGRTPPHAPALIEGFTPVGNLLQGICTVECEANAKPQFCIVVILRAIVKGQVGHHRARAHVTDRFVGAFKGG